MKSSKDNEFSITAANAGRGVEELLVDPISQGGTTVRNPFSKTQPTMDWMKSSKDNKFSVTAANAGRGVAELLVNPISQGLRVKHSQKEYLKKNGEVDGFKKYNNCKKSKDFKNDDSSDKTDDFRVEKFKKTNDCKKSRDFKNDDGSDNTDDFKKTDDFR